MQSLKIFSFFFITNFLFSTVYVGGWQRDLKGKKMPIPMEQGVYYGQFGQDKLIHDSFFKNKKGGVFVEFGASDGVMYSNSLFFEKTLNWTGLLIEPIPFFFNQLVKNRSCPCVNGCITASGDNTTLLYVETHNSYEFMMWTGILESMPQPHIDRIITHVDAVQGKISTIEAKCYRLNNLLENNNITRVDYLSIDCECGELEILQSIDYKKYDIDVIGVEANFQAKEIKEFLTSIGYDFITYVGDYIYKKNYSYD